MRTVAVLCAANKTAYRDIPGVEVYDETRDARTFCGGMPVIAHPPCRRWTQFGDNMLAGAPKRWPNFVPFTSEEIAAERELGIWCATEVQQHGGILEQPAGSRLFSAASIPLPGSSQSDESFSIHVWQAWWGFPCKKGTWLYFRGIKLSDIHIPFKLHPAGNDRKNFARLNCWGRAEGKSYTVPALAQWLVSLARTAAV